MSINKFVLTGLTALAGLGLGSEAMADGRNPGSLLLFPEFDNTVGVATVVTVTNTNSDTRLDASTLDKAGTVDVHFVYIGRKGSPMGDNSSAPLSDLDCEEFDRNERLTPNDTISVITYNHNPQQDRGYLYVYAQDRNGNAIPFNFLIGNLLAVNGFLAFEYSVNPVSYAGIGDGTITDLDGDGIRDLDGIEYEQTAAEILIPRFLGQGDKNINSELILIALSGGSAFTTTVDFLVYNDDEDQFSANRTFRCWERTKLTNVSTLFENSWLRDFSGQNPNKGLGPNNALEYGWFKMNGRVASSFSKTVFDPAIYATFIEIIGWTAAADLPFESAELQDGHLLPRAVTGDNSE